VKLTGRVLKPGQARRVDPVPGRPEPGTGPDWGKNSLGNWPGKTRSTRNPIHPAKPGWDPVNFFFIFTIIKRVLLNLLPIKPETPVFFPLVFQEDSRQGKATIKSRQHIFSPIFIAALHKQMVIWGGLGFCREYNDGAERERKEHKINKKLRKQEWGEAIIRRWTSVSLLLFLLCGFEFPLPFFSKVG